MGQKSHENTPYGYRNSSFKVKVDPSIYFRNVPGGAQRSFSGICGEAPPKGGTFLRLEVCKRVGISSVHV